MRLIDRHIEYIISSIFTRHSIPIRGLCSVRFPMTSDIRLIESDIFALPAKVQEGLDILTLPFLCLLIDDD